MGKTVSDVIFDTLFELGVTDCFCVVGGGAMHLDHALATSRITTYFNHHEQACAMAAEGYARYAGKPAVVCVTSGPGATNALTGVMGAWVDSIPMIVISGNVRYNVSVQASGLPLRYRGVQEFDIVNSIQNMTKYSKVLLDPQSARAEVHKAYELATSGRQGPVWLDVPLDVQGASVEEDSLCPNYPPTEVPEVTLEDASLILDELAHARRPCILLGAVISTAHLFEQSLQFRNKVHVPIVGSAWMGDMPARDEPFYYGSSGNVGPRMGNFILENADYVLALGNSLSYRQTGYNLEKFAPNARIAMVNVEEAEARKLGSKVDYFAHGTVQSFFSAVSEIGAEVDAPPDWISYCERLKRHFPPNEGARNPIPKDRVGKYSLCRIYNELAPDDEITVSGNSQIGLVMHQVGKARADQRLLANTNSGPMGHDLPASIGVAVASKRPVTCITGDGSIMMNLQELSTIVHGDLPIRIVLFENGGYDGIRQSQGNYFGKDFDFGSGPGSGVGFPAFEKIADAFGLACRECKTNEEVADGLRWALSMEHPAILIVRGAYDDSVVPKAVSKLDEQGNLTEPLLCDLSPFLSDAEMRWALNVDASGEFEG